MDLENSPEIRAVVPADREESREGQVSPEIPEDPAVHSLLRPRILPARNRQRVRRLHHLMSRWNWR